MRNPKYYRIIFIFVLFTLIMNACNLLDGLGLNNGISNNQDGITKTPEKFSKSDLSLSTITPVVPSGSPDYLETAAPDLGREDLLGNETSAINQDLYYSQLGSPIWLPNFSHPEAGCDWMGIAGQVFDDEGNASPSLIVEVGGFLDSNPVSLFSLTGITPVYGPGGYEVTISEQAIDSRLTLWVQLLDLEGEPLSTHQYFNTFADCSRNLTLMNFVLSDVDPRGIPFYLPIIFIDNRIDG